MEVAQRSRLSRRLHVVVRNLPRVLVGRRRFVPVSQAREDVRGHVIRVRHRGGRLGVGARGGQTRFGVNGIVVGVNEVVQHARMLLVVRVDRFEERDRTALHLESLRPFPDGAEDRQAIEQRGLIVRILRVRGGHLLAVGLVTRLLRPRAAVLVERRDRQEVHVLAIVLRPGFESLLHVRPTPPRGPPATAHPRTDGCRSWPRPSRPWHSRDPPSGSLETA